MTEGRMRTGRGEAPGRERLFLSGPETLARIALAQAARDRAAGLSTGGFISGYRGSPLGAFDQVLDVHSEALSAAGVRFQPAVNEELAATAIWGTQQLGLFAGARVDGVFAMWYGKGPGVDRAGDAFKHANLAGTSRSGGVLAVAGDDHGGVSSTTTHQSEFAFMDAQIPVLAPAHLQDVFDLGLAGLALSRCAGLWVALKCPSEIIEQAASVETDPERLAFRAPALADPPGGRHIRWPDRVTDQETRLAGPKLAAARAFVAENGLDRVEGAARDARIGVVAAGKAWGDLRQALAMLGLAGDAAARAGIRLYKPAMVWPLVPETLGAFADGLAEIVVIEEKRALIEPQVRDILYSAEPRPRVTGKSDGDGAELMPAAGVIDPVTVARALAKRLEANGIDVPAPPPAPEPPAPAVLRRPPHFCPGCPHNTSTRVPEGHEALAGIGCHTLALWSEPSTRTLTQMGGEGASWIGRAPFTDTPHVFANMGDGTYVHSGLLAIRAAVAAGVTMTYKLLYNDAVAMTGGQKVECGLSVPAIARELAAEGASAIRVIAEDPGAYGSADPLPSCARVAGREAFEATQRELAATPGVSVLIFDQTCAAEKRRRRRRGEMDDPDRWVVINERVCEGCGDCQKASHCLAVVPVATPFGEKRRIDHAACNKDETCLDGFCPAMVTVEGRRRGRASAAENTPAIPAHLADLPAPAQPALERPWRGLVAGIGGTGVVTVGHLIGRAAHADGRAVTVMDQTGLAQKGGSVMSHIAIAATGEELGAARTPPASLDLLLGCDLVVAADTPQTATLARARSRAVVSTERAITGAYLRDADKPFPAGDMIAALEKRLDREGLVTLEAGRLARALTGEAITANVLLLGAAWQLGLVPVSEAALSAAIAEGPGAHANARAFAWGRRWAVDADAVRRCAGLGEGETGGSPDARDETFAEMTGRQAEWLRAYGGAALAETYLAQVEAVARAESALAGTNQELARAVADGYFRVLAAKDEYEVARLFTDGAFDAELAGLFEGKVRIAYHMAPPLLARTDPVTGRPVKRRFGPWAKPLLKLLARLRSLRGGALDPFRFSADRRLERRHRAEYEEDLALILRALRPETHPHCAALARLPASVRGYGHVREAAWRAAREEREALRAAIGSPPPLRAAAQ